MAGRKLEHLNEMVRQKLGQLLIKEASDPRFSSVTITQVQVAKDLATARVHYATFDPGFDPALDAGALTASLNHAAGFFSHALGRTLATRRTPRLHFYYDPGFDYALEMEVLLKTVAPPEQQAPPEQEAPPDQEAPEAPDADDANETAPGRHDADQ